MLGRLPLLIALLTLLGGSLPGLEHPVAGVRLAWETVPARDDRGRPLGTLVVSALMAPSPPGHSRPVLVVFNGGPGASSGWLQLGLLGPLQVVLPTRADAAVPRAPILAAPAESLAAHADVLFVDPLDTGFSRRAPGVQPSRVRGWQADGDYLARAVAIWLARHGRLAAPVVLMGESFGAERAVAVAEAWQRQATGVRLAGIAMLSQTVLNETDLRATDPALAMAMGLPTVAATACHYGRARGTARDPLACADAAARLGEGAYLAHLRHGDRAAARSTESLAADLAAVTGLDRTTLATGGMAVDRQQARLAMLHAQGMALGLYDSRRAARLDDPRGWRDPSLVPYLAALGDAMVRYNARLLGLARSPVDGSAYVLYDPAVRRTWQHDAALAGRGFALADRLRTVLRQSGARLLLASGVFDSVGGYGADRALAARLALPPGQVTVARYGAGHMFYFDAPSRRDFLRRLQGIAGGATHPFAAGEAKDLLVRHVDRLS